MVVCLWEMVTRFIGVCWSGNQCCWLVSDWLTAGTVFVCIEQATSDDILYAEAGAGRFAVVISSIIVLLAGVAAVAWSDVRLSVWHELRHGTLSNIRPLHCLSVCLSVGRSVCLICTCVNIIRNGVVYRNIPTTDWLRQTWIVVIEQLCVTDWLTDWVFISHLRLDSRTAE